MDGILIPWPVPSSTMITCSTISPALLSIITARDPPACSIFLTFLTKEQPPLSTSTIGEGVTSGSHSPVILILKSWHPSLFSSSNQTLPMIEWPYGMWPKLATLEWRDPFCLLILLRREFGEYTVSFE